MRPHSDPFPTAFQAVLLFIALVLFEQLIAYALFDARALLGLTEAQRSSLTVLLGNGCVFALVMHFQDLGYRDLFHSGASSARATLGLIVPPTLLLVPLLLLVMGWVQAAMTHFVPLSAWEEQGFARMGSNEFASLLAVCVLAPVLEEMLFRGIVLRGFLQRYSRATAIVGSAVLFGAVHLNMYQFMVGLVAGLILGWLYERTRSLIPCIALHGAYNTGATMLSEAPHRAEDGMAFGLLSLVAAVCGALALRRLLGGERAVR